MRLRVPWERKYNGRYKVELSDPNWIESMDDTLNAIEREMQHHDTETIVEDLVSLLRARAVKAAHEVHRLRTELHLWDPPTGQRYTSGITGNGRRYRLEGNRVSATAPPD